MQNKISIFKCTSKINVFKIDFLQFLVLYIGFWTHIEPNEKVKILFLYVFQFFAISLTFFI